MTQAPKYLAIFLFLSLFTISTRAQTTIFNVPSTETAGANKFYLEADAITNFSRFRNGGFQTYGARGVYGVGTDFEVGANFFFSRGAFNRAFEFQPNLKFKALKNERLGVTISSGATFFVPLNRAAGNRTYAMSYTNVSKKFTSFKGTRVTGGLYTIVGIKESVFGTKKGAIVGVEQPLTKRLTFVADWYSGKNRFGYSTAGFNLAIPKNQSLTLGYSVGNFGRRNNTLTGFYSITF